MGAAIVRFEVCGVCVCYLLFIIPLHAARRAMAAGAGILQNIHVLYDMITDNQNFVLFCPL